MSQNHAAFSRRRFLRTAAQAGAVLALPQIIPSSALGDHRVVAPSERIVMGGLGIRGRGMHDLRCFLKSPDVQFVAICDVRTKLRQTVKSTVDSFYNNTNCAMYENPHEFFARPDIDAVLIATGDRWHTMAAILAAKAGKDIYSEKPCSTTIQESIDLANTIKRYGVVYQAGTQRRNIANFILAADLRDRPARQADHGPRQHARSRYDPEMARHGGAAEQRHRFGRRLGRVARTVPLAAFQQELH